MSKECDILLVEDNPGDARLIQLMLGDLANSTQTYRLDHRVTLADALSAVENDAYDLILLDMSLPDGSGMETLTTLREQIGDTPVVLVTGRGSESLAVEAMKTGAADYLSKNGLAADVLHRTIHGALEHAEYERKLQELEAFKASIVATASHELRTPLAIIREFVSLVHDGVPGPVNEEQQECLSSALRNCDRLASLINDTLDLHRLEQGSALIRRKRTNLWGVLDGCANDFEVQCRKKQQTLELDLPEDLPSVLADPSQVSQVVVNLLGNAHKFTPDGGTITLRATAGADFVSVSVRDTGPGVRPEDQARVFQPFAQVDRQDGPGARGTGLGLAICQRILDAHDGEIRLESDYGAGSTFTFTLPVHDEKAEALALLADQQATASSQGRRITCVAARIRPLSGVDTSGLVADVASIIGATLRRKEDSVVVLPSERCIMAVGPLDRPGSNELLSRVERAVLEGLGHTVPVDFAGVEVAPGDDVADALDGLHFEPARMLPIQVMFVGSEHGIGGYARELLLQSGLPIDLVWAEDIYSGMLDFGRFQPRLVLMDPTLPPVEINAFMEQVKSRCSICKVLTLDAAALSAAQDDDSDAPEIDDLLRRIAEVVGASLVS